MSHVPIARLAVAALLFHSAFAFAGQIEIDLPGALDLAHKAAPLAVAARGQLAIARSGVTGANVTFVDNPEIEVGAGPRLTGSRPIDAELRVEQNLEPWRLSLIHISEPTRRTPIS